MNERKVVDCNSPDFIPRFFSSSRLHHLSTWKSELSEMVANQITKNNRPAGFKYKASKPDEAFRTIMHIDMDCFFASVGVRHRPHLKGKPVAVAHSQGGLSLDYSTSEIASCNYEARAKGVKNGSFIGSAKELCPDLTIIPYEFEAYDECSKQLYNILLTTADYVQAVSCDEALIDITFIIQQKLMEITKTKTLSELEEIIQHTGNHTIYQQYEYITIEIANHIREIVYNTTQCHASIGIGSNLLLARISTNKAKPNGVHSLLQYNHSILHIQNMSIKDLPSVGRHIYDKCMNTLGLYTCGDIQHYNSQNHNINNTNTGTGTDNNPHINNKNEKKEKIILQKLKKELGDKIGEMIYNYSYGIDNRVLENRSRQSIGADINWGIRFQNNHEILSFLRLFCIEIMKRIHHNPNKFISKHIIFNIKKKDYIGEPGKYLGCGHCIDYSKSINTEKIINTSDDLYQHIAVLYSNMKIPATDIRGIGIHLKKLQTTEFSSKSLFHYISNKIPINKEMNENIHENIQYSSYNIKSNDKDNNSSGRSSNNNNNDSSCNVAGVYACYETVDAINNHANTTATTTAITATTAAANTTTCTIITSPTTVKKELEGDRYEEQQEVNKEELLSHSVNLSLVVPKIHATEPAAPSTDPVSRIAATKEEVVAKDHWAGSISIGDMDMDVFDALPEEIQEELRTALTQQQNAIASNNTTISVSAPTTTSGTSSVTESNKRKVHINNKDNKTNRMNKSRRIIVNSNTTTSSSRQQGLMTSWLKSK